MSCKRMWIDGKSYRILKTFYPDQVQEYCIQLIEDGYKRTFKIPWYYCKALQDNRYTHDIEKIKQGHSKLTISPNSKEDSTVTIFSDEEDKVGLSILHFHGLLSKIRDGIPVQQFLSVPVLNQEIQLRFQKFKEDVLSMESEGVEDSIFQKVGKLHLTINVFSLVDEQEVGAAKQALVDCKTGIIMPFIEKKLPLKLDIRGIDCMQGNHSKVHVLYAKAKFVDENADFNFQILLDKINEYFYKRGLTTDSSSDHVKIHLTLMNTKYRRNNSGSRRRYMKRTHFNATEILSQYKDFSFGQSDVNCINLCLLSGGGEYYKSLAQIDW